MASSAVLHPHAQHRRGLSGQQVWIGRWRQVLLRSKNGTVLTGARHARQEGLACGDDGDILLAGECDKDRFSDRNRIIDSGYRG
jgi:hypothetical protein